MSSMMTGKIPKKKSHAVKHEKPPAKSCALCKKYGGTHISHNTSDCKKYDHQGNLKKGFNGKKDTPLVLTSLTLSFLPRRRNSRPLARS
jgi:hypothetical protein